MTEQEREDLIEKMAKAALESDGSFNWGAVGAVWEASRKTYLREARAALEVAELALRKWADNALREENARLREAVKNAYYEGWQDRESIVATEDRLDFDWNCSEARYVLREDGT